MFLPEIQQIVENNINNMRLTDYVYGEVTSISPLKIKIDQKLELTSSVIILTFPVVEKKINIAGIGEVVIIEGLSVGDRVIMLRVEKGQKFIVLSKVV